MVLLSYLIYLNGSYLRENRNESMFVTSFWRVVASCDCGAKNRKGFDVVKNVVSKNVKAEQK